MVFLGIDPGLRLTGYAVIRRPENGLARTRQWPHEDFEVLEAGVFRLKAKMPVADRLVELDRDLRDVIERHKPAVVAVEKVYSHYEFTMTAAIMGHARGVVLLAARQHGAEVVELAATEVKKSLTGFGHAPKRQMQEAVTAQLGLVAPPEPPDVADAIAIALCAARRSRT